MVKLILLTVSTLFVHAGADQSKLLSDYANRLIITGGFSYENHKSEAVLRATYLENNDISFNDICLNSLCLSRNISHILTKSEHVRQVLEYTEQINIQETLSKLNKYEKISLKSLSEHIEALSSVIYKHFPVYSSYSWVTNDIQTAINSCQSNYREIIEPQRSAQTSLVSPLLMKALSAKCQLDFLSLDKTKCDGLVKDGFELMELDGDTGSFANYISDYFVNNEQLDEHLDKVFKLLLPITKDFRSTYEESGENVAFSKDSSNYPQYKDMDLGLEILKITGNYKDAIMLLSFFTADPGQTAIQKQIKLKLRRTDPERLDHYSKYMTNAYDEKAMTIALRIPDSLFGIKAKRNWSNRNYKALSGMVFGLGLQDKGYTADEAAWFAQMSNEGYKFNTHVMSDYNKGKDYSGNKPYFVIDSAAAYSGAMVTGDLKNNKGIERAMEYYEEGRNNSEISWFFVDKILGGKKLYDTTKILLSVKYGI